MKISSLGRSIVLSVVAAFGLMLTRMLLTRTFDLWFLGWNLVLAALPLLFSAIFVAKTKNNTLGWKSFVLISAWLAFLPNSFYIASDLIHLTTSPEDMLMYDLVLILIFTVNGFLLGYCSLLQIHKYLLSKLKAINAHRIISFVFIMCGFAIYLGRYLRWNSWDIIVNPLGLLFDLSERLINPASYGQTFSTTMLFTVLIATFYYVFWSLNLEKNMGAIKHKSDKE